MRANVAALIACLALALPTGHACPVLAQTPGGAGATQTPDGGGPDRNTSAAPVKSAPTPEAGGASSDGGTSSAPANAPPAPATASGTDNKPDWRKTTLPEDAAYAAFQRGYFVTAFKEAMKRIETGAPNSASAMTLIAELYRDGLGFREDQAEAARWYALAAKRGDAQAAFALGRAYLSGEGVKKDIVRAREFFEQAAAANVGAALYNLGIMAMEPKKDKEGEIVDFRAAATLFQKAANEGDLDAAYSLALLYRSGRGVPKDEKKAAQLLRQAADQHHLIAETEYAIALFNGKGVRKDEAAAAKYFIRAAWRNSPVAQNRLARMYAAGRGVKRDIMEAMKWHIIARASGIKDKWLEDKLPALTRTQRQLVNEKVRQFATK